MGDLVAVMQVGGDGRPVRAAGRDPRQPRVRVRRPLRRRRPRPQAAVADPGRRPRRSQPAVTARVGERRRRRPARRGRPRSAYLLLVDAGDRPLGWVDARRIAARAGRSTPSMADADVAAPRTGGRRSRTRCRCCSTPTSRRASSSTGPARSAASSRSSSIAAMRDDAPAHVAAGDAEDGRSASRRPTTPVAGDGCRRAAADRLGLDRATTSTTIAAAHRPAPRADGHRRSSSGFVISFVARDLGASASRASTARSPPSPGILYTIPSLAVFARPRPDHRALAAHRRDPARRRTRC